ncbi:MAG: 4-alpha-glucanotransferase [Clostridiales bacterium]|nr:4-alpha-glucanotransferase [Clostridiales bacterium]
MFEKRGAGVLFPVSCAPSEYGVGVFGGGLYNFIDKISEMGFSYWQVLPLNPVDCHGSPYCSHGAFAGDYMFINPAGLVKSSLVSAADAAENIYSGSAYTANYDFAHEKRLKLLRAAYKNITPQLKSEIEKFTQENVQISAFALYMAVKESEGGAPWHKWPRRKACYGDCLKDAAKYEKEAAFWRFVQYIFYSQWKQIKDYANSRGIAVIGDMPFYVSFDSADVWANTALFDIDEKTFVQKSLAGVPPDYFSADGQLWGNPIYNWAQMKRRGYDWWLGRLGNALSLFDAVRVDHFRAFASYWQVPAGAENARVGQWKIGAGTDFFDRVFEKFPHAAIIAEDLGSYSEDVLQLLSYTGFPGMRVAQFAFDVNGDSSHLPHNVPKNSVSYVGTHDNNTVLGWLWEASEAERRFALDYAGFQGGDWGRGGFKSESCRKITEAVWKSSSNTAIISFQDMCGFGSDARMNTPGVAEGNWLFRTTDDTVNSIDSGYFLKINNLYRRRYSPF